MALLAFVCMRWVCYSCFTLLPYPSAIGVATGHMRSRTTRRFRARIVWDCVREMLRFLHYKPYYTYSKRSTTVLTLW
jgi:hypothetical protein